LVCIEALVFRANEPKEVIAPLILVEVRAALDEGLARATIGVA
jgi:hypothetical protein